MSGAGPPKRLTKLRDGFVASLAKWKALLTQPVSDEEFKRAFRETGAKYPAMRNRVCGDGGSEGILYLIVEQEFPLLNREMPDAIRALLEELFDKVIESSKEELEVVIAEYGLAEKFAALEGMEEDLKRSQAAGAQLPPPLLRMSPEDELRSPAMAVKLNYEAAVARELAKLRKENAERDATVAALDARAQKVLATVEARAGLFAKLAAQAEAAGLTQGGDSGDEA